MQAILNCVCVCVRGRRRCKCLLTRQVIAVTNDALESRLGSRLTGTLIQRTSVFCRIDGEFALPRTNSPRIRVAIRYETASHVVDHAIFHRLHPPSVVWTITRGERARTNATLRDKLIFATMRDLRDLRGKLGDFVH